VLDGDAAIGRRQHAEPHAPSPVIGRHADNSGVVPEAAIALTGKRQSAMSGDDAVASGSRQFFFDRVVAGREDETVVAGHAAMNHEEAAPVDLEV